MRFDEAFCLLLEHCVAASKRNAAGVGPYGNTRQATKGSDVWINDLVREVFRDRLTQGPDLTDKDFAPFYDAAWELCRIGVLRPGPYAAKGISGAIGGSPDTSDGYSITEFGNAWLANPERRIAGDPSRMSEIFSSFTVKYGSGFAQRTDEAIKCHRNGNYLATCVMAGAAAESILLAIAIAKDGDDAKVLKLYGTSGGRGRVTKQITNGLTASVARTFEAALQVLHFWRDDASHGKATTISELEAYASLTQLLRLAQFSSDRWTELTA